MIYSKDRILATMQFVCLLTNLPFYQIFFYQNKSLILFVFNSHSFANHNHIGLKTKLISWYLFKKHYFMNPHTCIQKTF